MSAAEGMQVSLGGGGAASLFRGLWPVEFFLPVEVPLTLERRTAQPHSRSQADFF